jgi:IrrE N-terminal-like domain
MKHVHSKGSIETHPRYEDYEIERMCIEELQKSDLLPDEPAPIRIDRFIEKRFELTPDYLDLKPGLLGFTKFGSFGAEAIVISRALGEENTAVSKRRVRTTLAHEAGHALLHASLFDDPKRRMQEIFDQEHEDLSKVLCRDVVGSVEGEHRGYDGSWWEFQANRAMGSLLLPETLFRKSATPFLTSAGLLDTGPATISPEGKRELEFSLSDLFDVNPVVVRFRLHQLYPSTR